MKSHDMGLVFKSLGEAKEKLQAIRSGYNGVMHSEAAATLPSVYGRFGSSPVPSGRGKSLFVPLFNGDSSRAFVSWLYEVECYFNAYNFSDEMKCGIVVSCLKGLALLWYNSLELSRTLNRKGKIRTWCLFRMLMIEKFLPSCALNELWAELKTLKQTSMSVDEYTRLFEELHFVCDANVECVQKGVRFYHGLNSEISKQIDLFMKYTFDEMYELALNVEKSHVSKADVQTVFDKVCEPNIEEVTQGLDCDCYDLNTKSESHDSEHCDNGISDEKIQQPCESNVGEKPVLYMEKKEHQGCDVSLHSSIVNTENELLYVLPNSSANVSCAPLPMYRAVCAKRFEWLTRFNETMLPQKLKSYTFGVVYYKGDLFSFVPMTCSQNLTTYSTYKHLFQTTKTIFGEGNTLCESLNLSGDRFGKEHKIVQRCFAFTRETQSVSTMKADVLYPLSHKNAARYDGIKSSMLKCKGNLNAGWLSYTTRGKGIGLMDVMLSRQRNFVKVFDPGGGCVFHLYGVAFEHRSA